MNANLICFHCRKGYSVEINRPPHFAFELVNIANSIGMKGVLDIEHSRSLVFCNDTCANAEKKKNGSFRLRSKGVAKAKGEVK